jgi:hypothetical protein
MTEGITHSIEWNIDQSTANETLQSVCFGDQMVLVNDVVLRDPSQMRSNQA